MSQLERRLAEQLANAIEIDGELRRKLDQEASERKKITEMYLETNQACIDAEANVSVLMVEVGDLRIRVKELVYIIAEAMTDLENGEDGSAMETLEKAQKEGM